MTDERRRFFPAKGAQTVPGAVANVLAQLQPKGETAAPTPAPAAADIAGPALLPEWRYEMGAGRVKVPYSEWDEWSLEYEWGEGTYWYWKEEPPAIKHGSGYVLPAAQWSTDGRMTACWINIDELQKPLRFRALLLGRAMSDVQWTAELDTSMKWPFQITLGELWPQGVDVEDEGHSLLIRVHPGSQMDVVWAAHLKLTASAGGKEVGSLSLHLGWNTGELAQQALADHHPYDFAGWDGWQPSD